MIGKDKKDKSKPKSVRSVLTILLFFTLIILINNAATASLIKVYPRIENITIEPRFGYWYDTFNISFDCRYFKNATIELEIYDLSKHNWVKINKSYHTDPTGNAKKMSWLVKVCSGECSGNVKFRVLCDGEVISEHIGPELLTTSIFKNATVTPQTGHYNTTFNFSVEVPLQINKTNLSLYIFNFSSNSFDIYKYNTIYSNSSNNKVYWRLSNIFSKNVSGLAKFKFGYINKFGAIHYSEIYYGPILKSYNETPKIIYKITGGGGGILYRPYIKYKNATVEPNWILIGMKEVKFFNYSVEINKDETLILEIYNLSSKKWENVGKGKKIRVKDKWKYKWAVNLTLDKNWKGISEYRFYPEGRKEYASQIYYGPEIRTIEGILTGWKKDIGVSDKPLKKPIINSSVNPYMGRWFKKFTYTAEIKHPERANMTVVLFVYKPGTKEWKPVPWRGDRYNCIIHSSDYDKNNVKIVNWTVEKKDVFNEEDAGKHSKFYIWYWDGYNEYNESKGYFDGPDLLINREPQFVRALKPKPESGSTRDVYEYTFEINDPENDIIHGWLTIIDPLNRDHVIEGWGKDGKISFRVGPNDGIFTEDKLREFISKTNKSVFTSRYKLEYWDEGMKVIGKIKTTDWFEGPNISLVRVEPKVYPPEPGKGKYIDDFKYSIGFYSSKDNIICVNLTVFDPSNPKNFQTFPTKTLSVSADTTNYTSWKIKPKVFGPDDFGKTASYKIEWVDIFGNKGTIICYGPYIENAVPLFSWEPPLVPLLIVIAPLATFGISSLIVLPRIWYRLRERWGI